MLFLFRGFVSSLADYDYKGAFRVSVRIPSVHLLSDGIIKYDGGSVFGQIPKMLL